MSNECEKRKRKVTVKSEFPVGPPKKWKPEEMSKVYNCILQHGHKNLKKLKECLPERSEDNIKAFLRGIFDKAGKSSEKHQNIDSWITRCISTSSVEAPWRDCLQVAQIIKYLSEDGLLENHPLPDQCDGIDFRKAYRLVYQALMGYPVQPVNKETILFVQETITEIIEEVKKEPNIVKNVESFLIEKLVPNVKSEIQSSQNDIADKPKKPVKSYQRKTPKVSNTLETQAPSLKIVVEPVNEKATPGLQEFSVTTEGAATQPVVVDVPVVHNPTPAITKEGAQLLKSNTYNPFQIPEHWLREPVCVNLLKS